MEGLSWNLKRRVGGVRHLFPSSHYVLLAVLFMVGLELIFSLQRWVVGVAAVVVFVVAVGVVLLRIEEQGGFHPIQTVLPILATIGSSGFAFLLPNARILHVYIWAAGLMLYFLLKHGARMAYPVWNWIISFAVFFLNTAFLLGLRFHLYIPVLLLLFLIFLLAFAMVAQAIRRIAPTLHLGLLPMLGFTLVLTETVWVLQFLPSHYLVQAGIVTVLYYIIFNLLRISYRRRVAWADILEYVGVGVVATLIISFNANWT